LGISFSLLHIIWEYFDADQSFNWLDQAINMDSKFIKMARTDSDFDSIRDHPCFKELIHN